MKINVLLIFIAAISLITSCTDPAIDDQYGQELIYMPQATHNLGTDNNLELSLSADAVASNPTLKTQTTLGIYRSGTAVKKSVTVDLCINIDTLNKAKAHALTPDADSKYDLYKTGILLEPHYYTPLPTQLVIPDGDREAKTQLVLNNADIFATYTAGQTLLLPVQIANPTRYTLNHSLSMTMVVIKLIQ